MRAQITLRGGAQIEVDITDLTTNRSPVSGGLTSLEWTTPDEWARKLHTVAVEEIVAIVVIQDGAA
jgi:hypothetical protein